MRTSTELHEVQEAIAPVDYIFVSLEERMKEALAIVDDAETKLDKMKVDNTHDLVKEVEAKAMVRGRNLICNASIMRKESRGFQLREDYPEMDNENWLKWIIAKKDADGEIELRTEDVPIDQYDYKPY